MKLTPLLLDLVVLSLVAAAGPLRRRSRPVGTLVAWIAMLSSLAAPLLAAAVHAPQWVTAVAVLMMVVGFSGLATVLSRGGLQSDSLSDETWAQFERDFARYVASQTRAGGAASSRRRRLRHSR